MRGVMAVLSMRLGKIGRVIPIHKIAPTIMKNMTTNTSMTITPAQIFDEACGDYLRFLERDYHIVQDFQNISRAHRHCVFVLRHGTLLHYVLRVMRHSDDAYTRSVHSCLVRHDHPRMRLRAGDLLRYAGVRTLRTSAVYGNIFQSDSYLRYARWHDDVSLTTPVPNSISETW